MSKKYPFTPSVIHIARLHANAYLGVTEQHREQQMLNDIGFLLIRLQEVGEGKCPEPIRLSEIVIEA